MECNVGNTDRKVRMTLAIILIVIGIIYNAWWTYIVALILIITVLMSRCGPYFVFGINTCKNEFKKKKK